MILKMYFKFAARMDHTLITTVSYSNHNGTKLVEKLSFGAKNEVFHMVLARSFLLGFEFASALWE